MAINWWEGGRGTTWHGRRKWRGGNAVCKKVWRGGEGYAICSRWEGGGAGGWYIQLLQEVKKSALLSAITTIVLVCYSILLNAHMHTAPPSLPPSLPPYLVSILRTFCVMTLSVSSVRDSDIHLPDSLERLASLSPSPSSTHGLSWLPGSGVEEETGCNSRLSCARSECFACTVLSSEAGQLSPVSRAPCAV